VKLCQIKALLHLSWDTVQDGSRRNASPIIPRQPVMEEEARAQHTGFRLATISVRYATATRQDEFANIRGGFSAVRPPPTDDTARTPGSVIARAIRLSTSGAVLAVRSMRRNSPTGTPTDGRLRAHGETVITSRLEPATIAGLVYAS